MFVHLRGRPGWGFLIGSKFSIAPGNWNHELEWLIQQEKGKSFKASIFKITIIKTIYELWTFRNEKSFGKSVDNKNIGKIIIDTILCTG